MVRGGFVLAAKRVSRPLNLRAAPIAFGDQRADAVACKRRDAREQRVGIDPAFVRIAQRLPPRLAPVQRGGRCFVLGDANLSVCLEPAIVVERIGERIATIEQELSAQPLRGKEARALGVADGYAGFVIARRYLSASGTVVLVTSTVFPYDRMRYSIALTMP